MIKQWMAALSTVLTLGLSPLAQGSDRVRGVIESLSEQTGTLKLANRTKQYQMGQSVTLESIDLRGHRVHLRPQMDVTLHLENSSVITRIVIHGPYSLLQQMKTH